MLSISLKTVIFSADGSASMPSRSVSQKWKVISSICSHSTPRGSMVTVQKNFIYFQACSCLSEPPGVEWRRGVRGGLHSFSTAGSWKPPALLFLGIPEVFWSAFGPSGSWTAAFTANAPTVCLLYIFFPPRSDCPIINIIKDEMHRPSGVTFFNWLNVFQ